MHEIEMMHLPFGEYQGDKGYFDELWGIDIYLEVSYKQFIVQIEDEADDYKC